MIKTSFYLAIVTLFTFCQAKGRINTSNTLTLTDSLSVRTDFQHYFTNCKVEGSVIVYDNQRKIWLASDAAAVRSATLPASTFKIANLLIALETGVIKDENEIVKWPGKTDTVKYGYRPDIYHDMSVKEAFEVSAGWVYVELAKRIGKENYKKYLAAYQYGNQTLTQPDADFWNFGAFGISPLNQINFLRALYEGRLPASKRNMDIVKRVMIVEQDNGYTISAKTGWTRDNDMNTGWWVGYVESPKGVYFFATRLLQDRKFNQSNFGSCRKEITKAVLRALDILPR
ncbi:penicillin-binding transpeptidase domain-containing protein [Flavisolibacter tropicus]|uniref:beta-lactamase n=1 Tax=Flavisolibacter tropicus TaxID=1492898 RepID=A0A172U346_9BACT|nr:penicillin-binding transpeptidase domain-containing protein [Flavisolibacter tropicus]ANE53588.1 beta-lactamase [Flavisolibacter tropicus]